MIGLQGKCKLGRYLDDINQQTEEMFLCLVDQMEKQEGG